MQAVGGVLASHTRAGPVPPKGVRTSLRLRTAGFKREVAGPFGEFLITHPPHTRSPPATPASGPRPPGTPAPCFPPTVCTRWHCCPAGGSGWQSSSYSGRCSAVSGGASGRKAWLSGPPDAFLLSWCPAAETASAVSGLGDGATSCAPPDTERGGHARCGTLQDGCKQKSSRKVISWKGSDGSRGPCSTHAARHEHPSSSPTDEHPDSRTGKTLGRAHVLHLYSWRNGDSERLKELIQERTGYTARKSNQCLCNFSSHAFFPLYDPVCSGKQQEWKWTLFLTSKHMYYLISTSPTTLWCRS